MNHKILVIFLTFLFFFSLIFSVSSSQYLTDPSCGDEVCNLNESINNCPEDCNFYSIFPYTFENLTFFRTDYTVGMFVFPAWHSAQYPPNEPYYDALSVWKERWKIMDFKQPLIPGGYAPRTPAFNFYEDNKQEFVDWMIYLSLNYGINLFVYDWYWFNGSKYLNETLDSAFMKSKLLENPLRISDARFAIMWTNHYYYNYPNALNDLTDNMNNEIIEYFKHPNYYKIDNKPVLFLWDINILINTFGYENTSLIFDDLRSKAELNGFSGVYLIGLAWGQDEYPFQLYKSLGFNATSAYNSFVHSSYEGGRAEGDIWYGTYDNMIEVQKQWNEEVYNLSIKNNLTFFPSAVPGWDNTLVYIYPWQFFDNQWIINGTNFLDKEGALKFVNFPFPSNGTFELNIIAGANQSGFAEIEVWQYNKTSDKWKFVERWEIVKYPFIQTYKVNISLDSQENSIAIARRYDDNLWNSASPNISSIYFIYEDSIIYLNPRDAIYDLGDGQGGSVLTYTSPEKFETHIRNTKNFVDQKNIQPKLFMIEAWDEWGEGSYIAPSKEWGYGYFEALSNALCYDTTGITECPKTIIDVDTSNIIKNISKDVFGQGLEDYPAYLTEPLYYLVNGSFKPEFINITSAMKFSNIRVGGGNSDLYRWDIKNHTYYGQNRNITLYNQSVYRIDIWYEYANVVNTTLKLYTISVIAGNVTDTKNIVNYSLTKDYGIKFWEINNEPYGMVGRALNNTIESPEDYAQRFIEHCSAIKEIDLEAKCGLPLSGFRDSYNNFDKRVLDTLWIRKSLYLVDFVVWHWYLPGDHWKMKQFWTIDKTTVKLNLSMEGYYILKVKAMGMYAETPQGLIYPLMELAIDNMFKENFTVNNSCNTPGCWVFFLDIDNGIYNMTNNGNGFYLDTGEHNFSVSLLNDYYNESANQDVNLAVMDFELEKIDIPPAIYPLVLRDKDEFYRNFLGSGTDFYYYYNGLKNIMEYRNLSVPVYITEHNFHPPHWKIDQDWSSSLYSASVLQEMLNLDVSGANLWTGYYSHGPWEYFGNWPWWEEWSVNNSRYKPMFYMFTSFDDIKKSSYMLNTTIRNNPTFKYNRYHWDYNESAYAPAISAIATSDEEKTYLHIINLNSTPINVRINAYGNFNIIYGKTINASLENQNLSFSNITILPPFDVTLPANSISYLTIDIKSPKILIISPENKIYYETDILLNFTINEPTSWIGYKLDNQPFITITGGITLTNLTKGLHNIIVYANDISGNMGISNKVYFSINPCNIADTNSDGIVGGADLTAVISYWGQSCSCTNLWCSGADIDQSGMVGGADYNTILSYWGISTGTCVAKNLSCQSPPPEPESSKTGKAYGFGKDKGKRIGNLRN